MAVAAPASVAVAAAAVTCPMFPPNGPPNVPLKGGTRIKKNIGEIYEKTKELVSLHSWTKM